MTRFLYNEKGLSLVEVLVSITILGIVIVPIMNFYAQTYKANHRNELQLALHTQAITAFEKIKSAVAEGTPLETRLGNYTIMIPAKPCGAVYPNGFRTGPQKTTITLSETNYRFNLTVNVTNYSNSTELEQLNAVVGKEKPKNLFKIDLTLTPENHKLQPEKLSVIKLSANGCGGT
ncbi:PilW family protein [Bacillus tuaregi]|uniref:PilW family protein n=1 Tax=Bacillus tuaregi TaxID=1816695 RepID=UPI0008F93431|nr:prepilin-type N-terminal cleavage/methylation domain-containing protein [Bacillus tuaregi]